MQARFYKNKEKQLFNKIARSKSAALYAAGSLVSAGAVYSAAAITLTYMPETAVAPETYVASQGYNQNILDNSELPNVQIYDSSASNHYRTNMQITRKAMVQKQGGYRTGMAGAIQRVQIGTAMLDSVFNKNGAHGLVPLRKHYNYIKRPQGQCLISIDRYESIGSYVSEISGMPVPKDMFSAIEKADPKILKYLNEHVLGHELAHCSVAAETGLREEFRVEVASYKHIASNYSDAAATASLNISAASRIIADFNNNSASHAMGHLFRASLKGADAARISAEIDRYTRLNTLVSELNYADIYEDDMPHFERIYHFFKLYEAHVAEVADEPYVDIMRNYIVAVDNINHYTKNTLLKYPDAYKRITINNLYDVESCLNYGELISEGEKSLNRKHLDCKAYGLG